MKHKSVTNEAAALLQQIGAKTGETVNEVLERIIREAYAKAI